MPDARVWTVSGHDARAVIELIQTVRDRFDDFFKRSAPEIGSTDSLFEQRVAGKENAIFVLD
jgi:hypothetical protein